MSAFLKPFTNTLAITALVAAIAAPASAESVQPVSYGAIPCPDFYTESECETYRYVRAGVMLEQHKEDLQHKLVYMLEETNELSAQSLWRARAIRESSRNLAAFGQSLAPEGRASYFIAQLAIIEKFASLITRDEVQ